MESTNLSNNLKKVYIKNEKGSLEPKKERKRRFTKIRTMLKKKQKK